MFVELSLLLSAQVVGGEFESKAAYFGGEASELLGSALADVGDVNNDGISDFAVTAPGATANFLLQAGTVTVYSGRDQTKLHVMKGHRGYGHLGRSVSAAGDVNADGYADFLIGAPDDSPLGAFDSGSAYVISGVNGSIIHHFLGVTSGATCGYSVAGPGDLNGDGYDDVAIGFPFADSGGLSQNGFIVFYSGLNGNVLFQVDGTADGDTLGYSMDAAGDVNGDGIGDVVVGSAYADFFFGKAHAISGADGSILREHYGQNTYISYGESVAGVGDINHDGFDDYAAGEAASHYAGFFAGSVFVYSGLDGSTLLRVDGTDAEGYLGFGVDSLGDFDLDGTPDLLIGSPGKTLPGRSDTGAAGIYSGATGGLIFEFAGSSDQTSYGSTVAGLGDQNGDHYPEVLIGDPYYSSTGGSFLGSVHLSGLNPFLNATTDSVSASTGGLIGLDVTFPQVTQNWEYRILMSAAGIGSINLGVEIPLAMDPLVTNTFFGIYPGGLTLVNMQGTLDFIGNAVAWIGVPPNTYGALAGRSIYMAAIAIQPFGMPAFSSVAVGIEIQP